MKASVGIRELRDRVSAVLRRVRGGETVEITDRDRPIALLVPVGAALESSLVALARAGRVSWSGGKPVGERRAPRVRGATTADAVIEDRR
jgi:prevent-host-death family protein